MGTRPEAIKMAPLYLRLKEEPGFEVKVCVTAQHREMLDQVLDFFDIVPDYDLHIMRDNQSLFYITASVLEKMQDIYSIEWPDYVFVQGDTTTTFASALAAFYLQISVCHVEAGLRTYNIYYPYPEEMNRQLVSKIATHHFAPTRLARENLLEENIPGDNVLVTGNTVIDALLEAKRRICDDVSIADNFRQKLGLATDQEEKKILVTIHRRENQGPKLKDICEALETVARHHPEVKFIFPVHRNPNVGAIVYKCLQDIPNFFLIEPADYKYFVWLMVNSYAIITDSGGIQEEASFLGKPVLVVRDITERPEAMQVGTIKIVGTDSEAIVTIAERLLGDPSCYARMSKASNVYGDGRASERIADWLLGRKPADFG